MKTLGTFMEASVDVIVRLVLIPPPCWRASPVSSSN